VTESLETLAAHERIARARLAQYRRLARLSAGFAGAAGLATLLPWTYHPEVGHDPQHPTQLAILNASHAMGLTTIPAGPLVAGLALASLGWAAQLARGSRRAGWVALALGTGAVGVAVTEIIQLLLGRRNWIDHVTPAAQSSPLARAVGPGVWVALAAETLLAADVLIYLWVVYGERRRNRPGPATS
jgi:hypothetical protein